MQKINVATADENDRDLTDDERIDIGLVTQNYILMFPKTFVENIFLF